VIPVSPKASIDPAECFSYVEPEHFKSLPNDIPGRYHSVADYHELYLAKTLTPLAVAESLLPLVRRNVTPGSSHSIAFTDSKLELILEAARASTKRYEEGKDLGLLDGIPVGIKDEVDVAGYQTHNGRKPDQKLFKVQTESIWPVKQWQEMGAIIMGKMNMHEIGAG
jgi:Asp-tRNA(Asn)/Glu-tRNA(Gln) amidotransferase A subunit family amidase